MSMKHFTLFALAALGAFSLSAQSKIDNPGRLVVNATNDLIVSSRSALQPVRVPLDVEPDRRYSVIVTLDSEASQRILDRDGVEVISRNGDMAVVSITAPEMEALAALPEVRSLSLGDRSVALMNKARVTAGVDQVHAGTQLAGKSYRGRGVIAGLMDQGLDPNHINFLDANGEPRATCLWTISGGNASVQTYDTPQKIKNFSTEMRTATHGTHVLGIMAGSYNGPSDYAFINNAGNLQVKKQVGANSKNPFYGIATEAELAIACGEFRNNNVPVGVERVVTYAESKGMPAVVNVSIGNTTGPHDGTDDESRWFARLGEKAIICMSAGNDGDAPVSVRRDFSANPAALGSFVGTSSTEGIVEFWGNGPDVFNVTFIAVNAKTGETVYSYKIDKNLAGQSVTITGNYYTSAGYIHDPVFNSTFGEQGVLLLTTNVSPNNNRYSCRADLQLQGSGSDVVVGFIVEGKAGIIVDGYAFGGTIFSSAGAEGFTDGSPDCSINGMACGDNIIVVGSYNNKQSWPVLNMKTYSYTSEEPDGALSLYSSYGTTYDGRSLPDVCAPGRGVASSYSKYYIEGNDTDTNILPAMYTGKSRNSYWQVSQGTSMSSPFVAGVIATWLQADPSLTVADVKDIIAATADKDEFTAADPRRAGMGKINALAGLKHILGIAGIADIAPDKADIFVESTDGRNFSISSPGAQRISVDVVSLSGMTVASQTVGAESIDLDLSKLAAGVYVIRIATPATTLTEKISVN